LWDFPLQELPELFPSGVLLIAETMRQLSIQYPFDESFGDMIC
jgi:hypothetical protein